MSRVNILNTTIDNLSIQETLQTIEKAISNKTQLHHVVVNAGKIVAMQTDLQLRKRMQVELRQIQQKLKRNQ